MIPPEPVSPIVTLHQVKGADEPIVIEAIDPPGPGGGHSHYTIAGIHLPHNPAFSLDSPLVDHLNIYFQNGPVPVNGYNGATIEHLLAISHHRLACFQAGSLACENNAVAMAHIAQAIKLLQQRTIDRIARGVEGKLAT